MKSGVMLIRSSLIRQKSHERERPQGTDEFYDSWRSYREFERECLELIEKAGGLKIRC